MMIMEKHWEWSTMKLYDIYLQYFRSCDSTFGSSMLSTAPTSLSQKSSILQITMNKKILINVSKYILHTNSRSCVTDETSQQNKLENQQIF